MLREYWGRRNPPSCCVAIITFCRQIGAGKLAVGYHFLGFDAGASEHGLAGLVYKGVLGLV